MASPNEGADGDRGTTILVVDDDDVLRRTVTRALERAGYRVLGAANGFEARTTLDAEERVDLVIMDLVLPGLEGQEVANLLKAHQPGIPVLYTSGYTSLDSVRTGAMREGEPFLRKPFEVEELLETVEEILN